MGPAPARAHLHLWDAASLQNTVRNVAVPNAGTSYRERLDAGLDSSGSDLGRQAVVVHALADTPDEGVRCWYRGQLPIPLGTESTLAIAGTRLVVKVTAVAPPVEDSSDLRASSITDSALAVAWLKISRSSASVAPISETLAACLLLAPRTHIFSRGPGATTLVC